MKKETISFRQVVQPGETTVLKERIKADGAITGAKIKFYPGAELDLKVRPYLERHKQRQEDIVTYAEGTKNHIAGDNDLFEFECFIDCFYDETFCVWVNNVNAVYAYDLVCDVIVQYNESGAEA